MKQSWSSRGTVTGEPATAGYTLGATEAEFGSIFTGDELMSSC